MSDIEEPTTKAPEPAYGHWYYGDLTLEQAQEMFPIGCTVRFFRGGGRLLGGLTGKVVGHYQNGDPMSNFGGRAGIKVYLGAGGQDVADSLGDMLGARFGAVPVQKISNPFRTCEVIDA